MLSLPAAPRGGGSQPPSLSALRELLEMTPVAKDLRPLLQPDTAELLATTLLTRRPTIMMLLVSLVGLFPSLLRDFQNFQALLLVPPVDQPDLLVKRKGKLGELLQAASVFLHEATHASSEAVLPAFAAFIACSPEEVKYITPPKPKTLPSAVTPIIQNTASYMSSTTTHLLLDPKLLRELGNHLWAVEDHRFFDTFFPNTNTTALPLPYQFPTDPTAAAVVQWFEAYEHRLRNMGLISGEWSWCSSGDRILYHDTTQRKLDLFTYPMEELPNPGGPQYEWSKVAVLGELKQRQQNISDFNRGLVLQLANYVRTAFHSQPGRRFVHAFSLVNARMRCWVFTRAGGIASSSLNLDSTSDLEQFTRVFNAYLTNRDLGLAGINIATPLLNFGDIPAVHLHMNFLCQPAVVTRATTCWFAGPTKSNDSPWVLKESWRYAMRECEGDLLRLANEKGVKGLAIYHAHQDNIDTVHGILGPCLAPTLSVKLIQRASTAAPKESKARFQSTASQSARGSTPRPSQRLRKRPSQEATSQASKRLKQSHSTTPRSRTPSFTAHCAASTPISEPFPAGTSAGWAKPTPTTASLGLIIDTVPRQATAPPPDSFKKLLQETGPQRKLTIPNRIHTRVLMSRGLPVQQWDSQRQLFSAFRDAIRGHESLLTVAQILHRDISINNIMLTHPSYPRADRFQGFLIDLDLAVHKTRVPPSGAPERTGTYAFLSIEALQETKGHIFHDDLQSFFFVFIWLCYTRPEDPQDDLLAEWDTTGALNAKTCLILVDEVFDRLLEGFSYRAGRQAKTVAMKCRYALWPHVKQKRLDGFSRDEVEERRKEFYQAMIQAFQDGVDEVDGNDAAAGDGDAGGERL
ncbi:hypothetical protein BDD12DRAFT_884189 [Trichophaea hybrida]|nr:hypothetical protein BDD12DRAFT_884189 [Trichophaea hybrida]